MTLQPKEIIGSYLMEEDAMNKVNWLKNEGYTADQIWVIRDRRGVLEPLEDRPITRENKWHDDKQAYDSLHSTSNLVSPGSLLNPEVKSVSATLMELGVSKEEAYRYEFDVKVGKILILADKVPGEKHESFSRQERYGVEYESAALMKEKEEAKIERVFKEERKVTSVNRPMPDENIDSSLPLDEQLLRSDTMGDAERAYMEEEVGAVRGEASATRENRYNNGKRYAENATDTDVETALRYHHGQPFEMTESDEEDVYDPRVMEDGSLRVEKTATDESPGQGRKPFRE